MKNGWIPGLIGHEWQEPQQHTFERLIDCFTTAPVLRHYDPRLPCRLETDASRAALAGVLSQRHEDGCLFPFSLASSAIQKGTIPFTIKKY